MKKSILALGAAAVVGGLGFAGTAQAMAYFGPGSGTDATEMVLNPGGIGHELYVPYYTAQGNTATLLSITNTDLENGKVVKVRFRGAANSDDVFDFTLYLSPGDVWAGMVTKNTAVDSRGYAVISTTDKSCTVPYEAESPWHAGTPFHDDRFAPYATAEQKAANTREGYVEILNMADVPKVYAAQATNTGKPNALWTAIKHVGGVAPCTASVIDPVSADTGFFTNGVVGAETAGLAGATGGLMGGWIIIDQSNMSQFSGNAVAIAANGRANIAVSAQMEGYYGVADAVTTDPLLIGNSPIVEPQWFDFPDMSTPMVPFPTSTHAPASQAVMISEQLAKSASQVINEFLNDPNGAVPMNSDWIVSQPSRRYFAAVDYRTTPSGATTGPRIVYNVTTPEILPNHNPYWTGDAATGHGVLTLKDMAGGPQACLTGKFSKVYDREESTSSTRPVLSPTINQAALYCGEVLSLSFGRSPLSANLTNLQTNGYPAEGWGQLGLTQGDAPLPIIGFAALNGYNGSAAVGATWPHRWYYGN